MKMKIADEQPARTVYLTLEEMFKVLKDELKTATTLSSKQPKRFTVHGSSDPSE
jgi:hypothetical protein